MWYIHEAHGLMFSGMVIELHVKLCGLGGKTVAVAMENAYLYAHKVGGREKHLHSLCGERNVQLWRDGHRAVVERFPQSSCPHSCNATVVKMYHGQGWRDLPMG